MENKKPYINLPTTWDDLSWMNITLSQEDYDSIFDGPRPNGSSRSWYIEETGKLQHPFNLGEWNFHTEYKNWFSKEQLLNQHQPHIIDANHCTYKYKQDLVGKKHLYIITVFNPEYFQRNRKLGFSVMDPQYINDVQNGDAYVVVLYPWEGYPGIENNEDFAILEEWRIKASFPKESVHLITGNLTAANDPVVKSSGLVTHDFCIFDNWNSDFCDEPLVEFIPKDDKYLYLSYNRNPRYPRVFLVNKLIEYNLLDKGMVSLQKPEWWQKHNIMRGDGVRDSSWESLNRLLPIEIGKNLNFNLACNVELADFEKTFCSIVTETLVENGTLFLSEKIWKPIQTGHPFFVLGNPGTLNYLRHQGYRTFSKWWDESYDHVTDYRIRTDMIIKEVEKLNNYSVDDLKAMRKEMKENLDYNKRLHYRTLVDKWGFNTHEKPQALLQLLYKLYKELIDGKDIL